LSILFRTKRWLTIAELVPAWAAELPGADKHPAQIKRHLWHYLVEDIINGRLDDAGPVVDGRRLGLRLITEENRAGFLEGHQVRALIAPYNTLEGRSFVYHRLLVLKEAILDFASRHQLPPPLWWGDVGEANADVGEANTQSTDAHRPERRASGPNQPSRVLKSETAPRVRGRRPEKLQQVKEAMKTDLRRGRYTVASLQETMEKQLAATYGVSRDTVRKARNAVVSEIAENPVRDK
jgi:hypothetical protein